MDKCWYCDKELGWGYEMFKNCPNCGCENDRTPYEPTKEVKEEVKGMIIDTGMTPFFKKGDVAEGAVGIIKTAFVASGKFGNPTGEVDFNGKVLKVSLNKTSLYDIVGAYGNNTEEWIGQEIIYSMEDIKTKQGAIYPNVNIFRPVR
uniref:Uncharacterized protein n=1 Tax=viral metagenome TaxID=1070528 RepID=A0A6H2A593_9ZZZZ